MGKSPIGWYYEIQFPYFVAVYYDGMLTGLLDIRGADPEDVALAVARGQLEMTWVSADL